jgi:hypothetical protein
MRLDLAANVPSSHKSAVYILQRELLGPLTLQGRRCSNPFVFLVLERARHRNQH